MSTGLFLASVDHTISDFQARIRRVKVSLASLQHQDSAYAQDHRALLAAYSDAIGVLKRHRDHAVNASSPVEDSPTGPACPVCCAPSWPMSDNANLWRCSRPHCPVSSFSPLDEFGRPLAYNIGGRPVLSMVGAEALLRASHSPCGEDCVHPDHRHLEGPSHG